MEKVVPLISSDTEGPLGVKHLPRLWLKGLLGATGQLAEGYKDIRPGFDYMVLEGIRIDPEAARNFINEHRPTYPAFERWVREQPGVDLSPENVAKINTVITERSKPPEVRRQILAENGLGEDCAIESSVMLNNLDDWRLVHAQVTG